MTLQRDAETGLEQLQRDLQATTMGHDLAEVQGWWQLALGVLEHAGRGEELLASLKNELLEGSTSIRSGIVNQETWQSILWQCTSIPGLRLVLEKHQNDVEGHRTLALDAVAKLPREPTLEEVARSGACERCREAAARGWRSEHVASCMHCLAADVLGTYDHKLFQARKLWEKKAEQATALQDEPLQLEGEEVALIAADSEVRGRAASEAERVLRIIQRMLSAENSRAHGTHQALLHHAELLTARSQKMN